MNETIEQPTKQVPPATGAKEIDTTKYNSYQPKFQPGVLNPVGLDLGYSSVKTMFLNEFNMIPTAIAFSIDTGIDYGNNDSYIYENENLYVGNSAVNESFSTLDYKFKYKYDPLLIFHSLLKLGALDLNKSNQDHLELRLGLALGDWKHKDEYIARVSAITVDGKTYTFPNIRIIPQGAGSYITALVKLFNNEHPDTCSVIDIGFNTINFLYFVEGQPQRQQCRSYTGHGVSSIINSFTNWLNSTYDMPFSTQEARKIFMKNKFIYNGVDQEEVKQMILELKSNFIKKLKNSILVNEKKLLSTSEKVLFCGGGSNLIKDIPMPPNVVFFNTSEEALYSNVQGFMLQR